MIMTLRLLDPVPADAGGSGAERSVVAAAGITAERWRRRGATTDVGDEIEARALMPVKDDFDDATAAGRIIIESRALLQLQLEARRVLVRALQLAAQLAELPKHLRLDEQRVHRAPLRLAHLGAHVVGVHGE